MKTLSSYYVCFLSKINVLIKVTTLYRISLYTGVLIKNIVFLNINFYTLLSVGGHRSKSVGDRDSHRCCPRWWRAKQHSSLLCFVALVTSYINIMLLLLCCHIQSTSIIMKCYDLSCVWLYKPINETILLYYDTQVIYLVDS